MKTPHMPMTTDHARRVLLAAGADEADVARLLSGPKWLRDEFADHAMRSILVNADLSRLDRMPCQVAKYSYGVADAMLIRRDVK